jgi:hypothetical protein
MMWNARRVEARGGFNQSNLARDAEHDRESAGREITRRRLAGCVDNLSCGRTDWYVCAHDHIV